MPCLKKADLAKPRGLRQEKFTVEGDDYVCVRSLTTPEFLSLQENKTTDEATTLQLLAYCLVDDYGDPLFDGPEEVRSGLHVSFSMLTDMADAVLRLSGIEKHHEKNS